MACSKVTKMYRKLHRKVDEYTLVSEYYVRGTWKQVILTEAAARDVFF